MGKFEKLVLLTVLFAVAIVLAISFNRGGKETKAADPLAGAEQVLGQEGTPDETSPAPDPKAAPTPTAGQQKEAHEKSLLLNAGPESSDQAAFTSAPVPSKLTADVVSDPSHPILKESTGLRPSFSDGLMVYTAQEGDTWASLAQRFYQDGRYTRNLLRANDDMPSPSAGTQILVPVFDEISAEAGLQPSLALADPAAASTSTATPPAPDSSPLKSPLKTPLKTPPSSGASAPAGKSLEYEVQSGDTLSDISLAVFGTSTRWKEILDANKDKLAKPESLKVGMKLKIPEGGKLPPAKKPELKPKSAQKSEPLAATPKKKVL